MVAGVYPTPATPHLGTFIHSQCQSLVEAGHEVTLIHPKPGLPVLVRYAIATAQVLFKTLTGQFDVVHGHSGLWCLAARLQWSAPVVASFLGDDLLGEPLSHGRWSKKAAFVVHASRFLCHVVDAVIVKSEEMKRAASKKDAFVIPNGVDFALFRPIPRLEARAALGWDPERYYILFGNNPRLPRKRFQLAQAAVDCLRDRGINAELVVAHGLPQAQVVQYINASNAIILTSIHEGSPNIVKESMACNVPIVSTNVGDVANVMAHTSGCSVCPAEPLALAQGLEEALNHSQPTTGRMDIAHLECSVVAPHVLAVYEYALRQSAKKRSLFASKRATSKTSTES